MIEPLTLDIRVCLRAKTGFWGPGSVQLLELIRDTGSILGACQAMQMSYSKAWKMINRIERQTGFPVLMRQQGGSHGGGSKLTPQGAMLLEAYNRMCDEIMAESRSIFEKYFPGGQPVRLTDGMGEQA